MPKIILSSFNPTEHQAIALFDGERYLLRSPYREKDCKSFPVSNFHYNQAKHRGGFVSSNQNFDSFSQLQKYLRSFLPPISKEEQKKEIDLFIRNLPEKSLNSFLRQIEDEFFPDQNFKGSIRLAEKILEHGTFSPGREVRERKNLNPFLRKQKNEKQENSFLNL